MSKHQAIMRKYPNKPAVSASYLKVIFKALEAKGIDQTKAKAMRQHAGIHETLLHSDNDFISIEQYQKLIQEAIDITQDPVLGIHVGRFFELGTHGILSYASLGMPTVWDCLKLGEKFARMRSPMLKVKLSFEGEFALISFDTDAFSNAVYQFVIEGGICSYFAMLDVVFEKNAPAAQIKVRYDNPYTKSINQHQYQNLLAQDIVFNAPRNEIRLPKESVEKSLKSANSVIAKELDEKINELLSSLEENSVIDQVKQLVSNSIGFVPSQQTIAEHLNLSTRTLRRHLNEQGVSYQQVTNDVRCELAKNYLLNTEMRIEEIAYLLGFSSASHFSNTFKIWVDISPNVFRLENKYRL
jgi:AraC-like DNA-binding protein